MRLTTCVLGLALVGLPAFSVHGLTFPTRSVTILCRLRPVAPPTLSCASSVST